MKIELAPKHFLKIGNCYILWFEPSNQYLVVSKSLNDIMELYFFSKSQEDFLSQAQNNCNIIFQQAEIYYNEITELLISLSFIPDTVSRDHKYPLIPDHGIQDIYNFGNISIKVYFGSDNLKALIHPQWVHATSNESRQNTEVFHIFEENNLIYFFKDQKLIGSYVTADYHLLQGKFALQLINTLYQKSESDWIATFHASTVCNDQEAIMLVGDSGNGKSTLSAVMMANGLDVLADDFTPLSAENNEVYRFPSGISVKPGAFDLLKTLYSDFDTYPVFKSTSKNVKVKYIPPNKSMDQEPRHAPCTKIVYVRYDKNSSSNIQNIGIEKILETLIPESWISPSAENSKLFLDWLENLECFELNYSDNDFAVSNIKKLFHS